MSHHHNPKGQLYATPTCNTPIGVNYELYRIFILQKMDTYFIPEKNLYLQRVIIENVYTPLYRKMGGFYCKNIYIT